VTLDVQEQILVPDGRFEACTAEARLLRAGARLTRPLGGRRLIGQWRFSMIPVFSISPTGPVAPRMVAARAGDAMRALANQNIATHLVGRLDAAVRRQRPAAGQPAPHGVTLITR
jgi:hypothetical protein